MKCLLHLRHWYAENIHLSNNGVSGGRGIGVRASDRGAYRVRTLVDAVTAGRSHQSGEAATAACQTPRHNSFNAIV